MYRERQIRGARAREVRHGTVVWYGAVQRACQRRQVANVQGTKTSARSAPRIVRANVKDVRNAQVYAQQEWRDIEMPEPRGSMAKQQRSNATVRGVRGKKMQLRRAMGEVGLMNAYAVRRASVLYARCGSVSVAGERAVSSEGTARTCVRAVVTRCVCVIFTERVTIGGPTRQHANISSHPATVPCRLRGYTVYARQNGARPENCCPRRMVSHMFETQRDTILKKSMVESVLSRMNEHAAQEEKEDNHCIERRFCWFRMLVFMLP